MSIGKKAKKKNAAGKSSASNSTSSGSPSSKLPDLRKLVVDTGTDLDPLIVVRPTSEEDVSYPQKLFDTAQRKAPEALAEWESQIEGWCDNYRAEWSTASILEVDLKIAVYVFDCSLERVLLAYGLSCPQLEARDESRIRRFPDVNLGVKKVMGGDAVECDRGHFLGHAAGGELDINLFPHRRKLNRGWSKEGKLFRRMEQHVATRPGTLFYHRAMYNDDTWIPDRLEYGLLVDDSVWWVETFSNKNANA